MAINRKTRNAELGIRTDMSSQTWQTPWVDVMGSGFGLPRGSGSGFWRGLEPNKPVANTNEESQMWIEECPYYQRASTYLEGKKCGNT